ncbi:hypothetical protein AF6_1540 [Anoxybacillus flavithermus TNO-09.006]|nr:hypothetical protein [Anoxybacillus flavithermus]ELK21799.1 hypothetical protein AF6_1540 [Anoxybacillus flavithermus TNO-09.006]
MALFALLVTVPACQVIKTGHGDRKFFITTYIEALHDFIQALVYEGEDVGIDYPDDLFAMDYLFRFFI